MSLINRMLQDLEARRATGERSALPNEVRNLPAERHLRPNPIVIGVVVAAALAAGAMLYLRQPAPAVHGAAVLTTPLAVAPKAVSGEGSGAAATPQSPAVVPEAASPPAAAEPPRELARETSRAPEVLPPAAETALSASLKIATSLRLPAAPAETAVGARPAPPLARPETVTRPTIEKQVRPASLQERAESDYRRALVAMNQGRIGDAIAGLRAVLELDGSHVSARLSLAGLLVEQKRLDEAQATLSEGLSQSPGEIQLPIRLARVQAERGDLRGAADTLQKAAAQGFGSAELRALHAAILQRLGRHREAAEEYRAALRLSPQSGVWWMGLGISLEAEGRDAEAREAFQKARASGALSAELERYVEQKLRQLP